MFRGSGTPFAGHPGNHARRWLKRPPYSAKFRLASGGRLSSVDITTPGQQAG
jgi:hypothetical protein